MCCNLPPLSDLVFKYYYFLHHFSGGCMCGTGNAACTGIADTCNGWVFPSE